MKLQYFKQIRGIEYNVQVTMYIHVVVLPGLQVHTWVALLQEPWREQSSY